MDRILIDTDVIIDFFADREPYAEHASRILTLCDTGKIKGYITPVILSNSYCVLKQGASHAKVIDKLKQLLRIVDVLTMDNEVCMNALHSEFKDFEDALQNFAAVRNGKIDLIITRNLKDYKLSSISVLTPETYIKLKSAGN